MRSRGTLIWVVIALLFVDLTFFSGASNFLASPQSRILNQLLIVGVAVGTGIAAVRGRIDLRSSLILPGAAWVAANAFATLTSARPGVSIEALALLLISVPAYFAIRAILADDFLRSRIDRLFVVATAIFVVAYLLQCLTQWLSWWSIAGPSIPPLRPGDVGLTVGTVNAVALYLELMAPIAVWLSWTIWRSRPFTIVLTVLSAFALLVTGSRGAWLGAAAGLVIALLLAWRERGVSIREVVGTTRARVIAVVVVLGIIAAVPLVAPRLLLGDEGRLELWSAAWSMIVSSPIVGVGPGAWPDLRASTPISDDIFAVLYTSHNSVLQTLTDAGLVGLLAGLWLVVAIARLAWRALAPARDADVRPMVIVAAGSLVACGVHSVVDTQFHIPAIVLLVFHLVARIELAAGVPAPSWSPPRRAFLAMSAAIVLVGVVRLVPIDLAMVRAASGNQALDRGDAAAAAQAFDGAVALHDLPAYRLGQAIAERRLGDDAGAAEAMADVAVTEPFTFVLAQQALLSADPASLWQRMDAADPYDATVSANLADQRFATEPDRAAGDLANAMVEVQTLVYSARPDGLLDDATWSTAQGTAIERIGTTDPVTAAAVAILADRTDDAAAQRATIPPGPESDALDLLDAAVGGSPVETDEAIAILRDAPSSTDVQFVLWQLGFVIKSQPLLDAVRSVSVPLMWNVPTPPMELVTDGRVDADYSVRLPRWPQAAVGRTGPKRPYIEGFITIEPVYRPK